jgi:uncharacterized DUF497 family protein
MEFEWDTQKAEENFRKHGISFYLAALALRDPFAVEGIDDREGYGEERIAATAMVRGLILRIVYTEREDSVRIISARKATRDEQDHYYRENGS